MYWWNAEAAYAADQACILQQAGHRVWVLTTPYSPNAHQLERRGLSLLTHTNLTTHNPFKLWQGIKRFRTFLQAHHIQVVNVFRSSELIPTVIACGNVALWPWPSNEASMRPCVVRTRGIARPMRKNSLSINLQLQSCAALVAPSKIARTQWASALQVPSKRIHCIYQPAPVGLLGTQNPEQKKALRTVTRQRIAKRFGLNPTALWFAMVGRVAPEKGHEPLLRAFAQLQKSAQPQSPDLALLMCTKDDGGALRSQLMQQVQTLQIGDYVRWLPFVQDLPWVVHSCDVGVIPSIASEVNCRIALEFMALGLPVVAFPTGALPEVVLHQVNGLIARNCSVTALADVLQQITADALLRKRLGQGAAKQACNKFSPTLFLQNTLDMFQRAKAHRQAVSTNPLP